MPIREARTDADIALSHAVMSQLRPGIPPADYLDRVRRQQAQGYRLAMVEHLDRVVAVAGFRQVECLAWGRALYVDDLVTDEGARSGGHGRLLFQWLVTEARRGGCRELHLDSGVQRFGAHRFYLSNRMDISSHHFRLVV